MCHLDDILVLMSKAHHAHENHAFKGGRSAGEVEIEGGDHIF